MDYLLIVKYLNSVALVFAATTAIILLWHNARSQNFALATAALCGAVVFFYIQIRFTLEPTTSREHVSTEFTFDLSKPEVKKYKYIFNPESGSSLIVGNRMGVETQASECLAKINPGVFKDEARRNKIVSDLTLYSVVGFLITIHPDWQMKSTPYKGGVVGTFTQFVWPSKESECTSVTESSLLAKLKAAGNLFSDCSFSGFPQKFCLPPKSEIGISENTVRIANPFCQISFAVDVPGFSASFIPGTSKMSPALEPPGHGPRWETRVAGVLVSSEFTGIRIYSRDIEKYQNWISQITNNIKTWFAP